ncbi:MAG: hypothetical protein QF573_00105 [Chloroflexota bacterium]|jgi:hypothetical protein|nr:hypothetical protein [Chloroflexota bacterium]
MAEEMDFMLLCQRPGERQDVLFAAAQGTEPGVVNGDPRGLRECHG